MRVLRLRDMESISYSERHVTNSKLAQWTRLACRQALPETNYSPRNEVSPSSWRTRFTHMLH